MTPHTAEVAMLRMKALQYDNMEHYVNVTHEENNLLREENRVLKLKVAELENRIRIIEDAP